MAGKLDRYEVSNAHETIKKTRHRHFTEAEFYRPMSQLYDAVFDFASRKRIKSIGLAFLSNGVTHLIAGLITDIPDLGAVPGTRIKCVYTLVALALTIAGIVMTFLSYFLVKDPKKKENMLNKYIDKEFADDDLASARSEIADGVIDLKDLSGEVRFNDIHPKHANNNQDHKRA